MTSAWRYPAPIFRCGACGTQAGPFTHSSEVESFATLHAKVCPGFPPQPIAVSSVGGPEEET